METHRRTVVRSLGWMAVGSVLAVVVTYLWFGDWSISLGLNAIIIGVNTTAKLIYEFVWKYVWREAAA